MDKVQARLILEILGRPKEHVSEALKLIVDKIGKEKGVKVIEQHLNEPVEVKDSKDLFTSFTEIIVECDNLSTFFGIVFAYMPANIEILEPAEVEIRNEEFTQLASRIVQRLHNYDAIARRLVVDNQMLKAKLTQMQSQSQPQQPIKLQEIAAPTLSPIPDKKSKPAKKSKSSKKKKK